MVFTPIGNVGTPAERFGMFIAQTQTVQAICIEIQSECYRASRKDNDALTMGSL